MSDSSEPTTRVVSVLYASTGALEPTAEDLEELKALFEATEADPAGVVVTPTRPFHETAAYWRSLGSIKTPSGVGVFEDMSRTVFHCIRPGEEKPFSIVPSNDTMITVCIDNARYETYQLEVLLAFNPPDTVVFDETVREAPSFIPTRLTLDPEPRETTMHVSV